MIELLGNAVAVEHLGTLKKVSSEMHHFIIGILLILLSFNECLGTRDWTYHARRLTGVSEKAHGEALAALKATPQIDAVLAAALESPHRYLALDAIGALAMQSLLPKLFETAKDDENGALYLAINALLGPSTKQIILDTYVKRLEQYRTQPLSLPSHIVILDVLGRLKYPLGESLLKQWMESPHYELRSAVVYYVRLLLKKERPLKYFEILERGLSDPANSLRIQTLYVFKELGSALPSSWKEALRKCLNDGDQTVQALCRQARG